MDHASEVMAFVAARMDAAVTLLERLVAIESPSQDPVTHAPAFALLETELKRAGFAVRYLGGKNASRHMLAHPVARRKGRPLQLLLGHIDTVWPVGTLVDMPMHRDADQIAGPGAYDMKAGLVQALFALEAAYAVAGELEVTPVMLVNSDEEIGSHGSRRYIETLARRSCRAFVMEPSLGVDGRLKTARKGVGRYRITIRGKAAHAGLDPEGGVSAILELSHQIQKLFRLNDPEVGITVNVGVVDGGLQPNVIAPHSSAQVDVRVPTHAAAAKVDAAIRGLEPTTPGVTLEVEGRIGRPPMEPDEASRQLWCSAVEAAERLGFPLEQGAAGGGSDGNFTSQFTPTLDGLGAVGDGAHAHHEHVLLDHMPRRTALLAMLLLAPPPSTH
jgi:glutamate carboxypeptidase